MSSIYIADELKAKLIHAARRHGFVVERGRQSQLSEYIAFLLRLDEQTGHTRPQRRTLDQAVGLLARPGHRAPSDGEVQGLLDARRMAR